MRNGWGVGTPPAFAGRSRLRRWLRKGLSLARRVRLAIQHEEGVHLQLGRKIEPNPAAGLARNRLGDKRPILGDRIGTGLVLPSPSLLIRAIAEIADQRFGLGVNALDSRAPGRRPGGHPFDPFHPQEPNSCIFARRGQQAFAAAYPLGMAHAAPSGQAPASANSIRSALARPPADRPAARRPAGIRFARSRSAATIVFTSQ